MASKEIPEGNRQGVYREASGPSSLQTPNTQSLPNLLDVDPGEGSATPPPYSSPSAAQSSHPKPEHQRPQRNRVLTSKTPGLPSLNYNLYHPPNSTLSSDSTTLTISAPEPCTYPAVLNRLLRDQASIPPKATVRITATGSADFDIRINIMYLLVGGGEDGGWNYLKVVEDDELTYRGGYAMAREPKVDPRFGVEEWARKFCADGAAIKEFTLERTVANWDKPYIEGRLHSLVASTGYRGAVSVTFPMTHSKVVVRSPDRVSRLWTNMTSLFTGKKRYEVVKVVWPYASVPPGSSDRSFVVQSEEAWWREWEDPIRHAILARRTGWVTVEDKLEFLMEPKRDLTVPREWGSEVDLRR